MDFESELTTRLWNKSSDYYSLARETSQCFENNPALVWLSSQCQQKQAILECGSGEGTKLNQLALGRTQGFGVDISKLAVTMAKDQYPHLHLCQGNVESLPLADDSFDCVYSVYTLEHLDRPEEVIGEMVRVARPGGLLVFIAPNFGSPLCPSPSSRENFRKRFVRRSLTSLWWTLRPPSTLKWDKVAPLALSDLDWSTPDADAVIEPYVQSLASVLRRGGLRILHCSSVLDFLEEHRPADSWVALLRMGGKRGEIVRRFAKQAAALNIQPFTFWGALLFVAAEKPRSMGIA